MKRLLSTILILTALLALSLPAAQTAHAGIGDEGWSPLGSGMNSIVYALETVGDDLYVGGIFTTAGGVNARLVAKWNGSNWSPLGTGVTAPSNPSVWALEADSSGKLYVGGSFATAGAVSANNIAKWDGSNWSALGSGMSGYGGDTRVRSLAVDGSNNLYAGGYFTTAGGVNANYIAKWNGTTWSPLGSGMNDRVSCLLVVGNTLYAGGRFTTAGGVSANRIAKWDGSAWSPLGSGMNDVVSSLAMDTSGNLYAGGIFTTAGGGSANYIAKWNGSIWSPVGSGVTSGTGSNANALAADGNGGIYVGGYFSKVGTLNVSNITRWDGSNWSALGSGVESDVTVLKMAGDTLYAGGLFWEAGGTSARYIAKWEPTTYQYIYLPMIRK
jgi:hypothetical protein